MRTTPGNPSGAAPAGAPWPPARARRGTAPAYLDFPLRPPLTRGASAHMTTRTVTQSGRLPQAGLYAELGTGPGRGRAVSESRGASRPPGDRRAGSRAMAATSPRTRPLCAFAPACPPGSQFAARRWSTATSAAPDPRSFNRPAGDRDRHGHTRPATARGPFAAAARAPSRRDWPPCPALPAPCAARARGAASVLRHGAGGHVSGRAPGQWWP
jgi:DNA polymerase-3 subunit gamma/tau